MYVIGFNGPPRSGKDTIATAIQARLEEPESGGLTPTIISSLSYPMRIAGFAVLRKAYSEEEYERIKDQPQAIFGGQTFRRWMIQFSEEFIKFNYGQDFWGRSLMASLGTSLHLPGILMIPDVGFQDEVNVAEDEAGMDRVLIVNLFREGTSFAGDSRNYVEGYQNLRIDNDSTIQAATEAVLDHAKQELGWDF